MNAKGKVFKYGDNVDTDVIIPARYLNIADPKELSTHAMEDIDADFVKNMHPGDIVVATRNFGCGSSQRHLRESSTATRSISVCPSSSAKQQRTASTQATR